MPQPFSSVPGFSFWSDLIKLMQAQNKLLERLPSTLTRLTEVLERVAPAASDAVETVHTSKRVVSDVEQLVGEAKQPIRDLIPAANDAVHTINTSKRVATDVEQLVADLKQPVRNLIPAANDAVDTSRRVTNDVEQLLAELKQPIRDLIPAIERLTAILNDPAIAAIPTTVQRMHDEAHPILDRMATIRRTATQTGQKARRVGERLSQRKEHVRRRPVD